MAVPLLAFLYSAKDSILIGCISATIIFISLAAIYFRSIDWRDTFWLTACALLGIPPGTMFLKWAGSSALLLAAGFALILFLLWQCAAGRLKNKAHSVGAWFSLPMGLASGFLMGGVGMGGPPLVLYIFLRNYTKSAAIGTINSASAAIILAVLPWQFHEDLYKPELLKLGLTGGIAALAGILLSVPLVRRLDIELFRRLLLIMLALSAAALLIRGSFFT